MAIITLIGRATEPVADFSVSGSNVTIAGVTTDCAARQSEKITHVEIRQGADGAYAEADVGAYVGTIIIPPKVLDPAVIEIDSIAGGIVASTGGGFVALDPNAIIVQLWPHVTVVSDLAPITTVASGDETSGLNVEA